MKQKETAVSPVPTSGKPWSVPYSVFADKMDRLTAQLAEQMEKGQELDAVIRERLGRLGYAV